MWQLSPRGDVRVFAGSHSEEGSVDGLAKNCRLKQPIGICTELDSVIHLGCSDQFNQDLQQTDRVFTLLEGYWCTV